MYVSVPTAWPPAAPFQRSRPSQAGLDTRLKTPTYRPLRHLRPNEIPHFSTGVAYLHTSRFTHGSMEHHVPLVWHRHSFVSVLHSTVRHPTASTVENPPAKAPKPVYIPRHQIHTEYVYMYISCAIHGVYGVCHVLYMCCSFFPTQ